MTELCGETRKLEVYGTTVMVTVSQMLSLPSAANATGQDWRSPVPFQTSMDKFCPVGVSSRISFAYFLLHKLKKQKSLRMHL